MTERASIDAEVDRAWRAVDRAVEAARHAEAAVSIRGAVWAADAAEAAVDALVCEWWAGWRDCLEARPSPMMPCEESPRRDGYRAAMRAIERARQECERYCAAHPRAAGGAS